MTWAENELASAAAIPDSVATTMTPRPVRKQPVRTAGQRRPRRARRRLAERYHHTASSNRPAGAGSNRLPVRTSRAEKEVARATN
jgi:hypothetical protein